jgi:chaperonin GroES
MGLDNRANNLYIHASTLTMRVPKHRNNSKGESHMKVKPLGDRVLLKRVEAEEEVRGGIIIPDTAKEKPQEAEVVSVGDGKMDEDGKRLPMTVKKGDRILIGKYTGQDIKINDEEHTIVREDEILAIIEK